jgi:hypothetical protein
MKTIPADVVEKTWKEVARFDKVSAQNEMGSMVAEQDEIIAFIHVAGKKMKQDAAELLMYMGFTVHRMFHSVQGGKLPKIETDELVTRYEHNSKRLENLKHAHEKVIDRIATVQSENQPHVYEYVVSAMAEKGPDAVKLSEKDSAELFLSLITIIDAIDQKIP